MALLAEELVEEWLRRDGYFTIRGAKAGNFEADLLAVKPGNPPTLRHVEVQCSAEPAAYITKLPRDVQQSTGRPANSAKRRSSDELRQYVEIWITKKYRQPKIESLRQLLWPGTWSHELVAWNVLSEEELTLIEQAGVRVWRLPSLLKSFQESPTVLKKADGSALVELILNARS